MWMRGGDPCGRPRPLHREAGDVSVPTPHPCPPSPLLNPFSIVKIRRRVLFHKHDQREDHDCQYHDAAKEAHHVGLHFAGFHVAHTASYARDRLRHAVDDAIDHVGVKGRFDIRDTEYHVAYEQIIQVVDVELAECEAMQET